MGSFENSETIAAMKDYLRDVFLSILGTVGDAFGAFYKWLMNVPIPVPPNMLKLFSNNKANFILFCIIVAYLIYINIRTYSLFAVDKKHAVKKKERVPEKKMFKLMWLGGATGAGLAMLIYRHKTLHKNFTTTAIVLVFIQMLLFSFILGFLGFWTFF